MAIESSIVQREGMYYSVTKHSTSHTGVVSIKVSEGQEIESGDLLYTITRLGLIKKRLSSHDGTVTWINGKLENKFCGYYNHVIDVEYELSPEEAQAVEEEQHYTFIRAEQGAQYFTTLNPGMPPILSVGDYVVKGQVIAVAMVMKKRREIIYEGERGRVAKIFFMNGQQCRAGDRLIGIVPKPLKK